MRVNDSPRAGLARAVAPETGPGCSRESYAPPMSHVDRRQCPPKSFRRLFHCTPQQRVHSQRTCGTPNPGRFHLHLAQRSHEKGAIMAVDHPQMHNSKQAHHEINCLHRRECCGQSLYESLKSEPEKVWGDIICFIICALKSLVVQ
jgi:hypothetical protein